MLRDIEIAQQTKLKPIEEIASSLGLKEEEVENYGKYKAKIDLSALKRVASKPNGKLILTTTITPTQAGEGKTTQTIGLAQALAKVGKKACVCIREPSLGPTMGVKGGAAGGGYSQVLPMEDINLHFTGDMHMIGAAHNLLAAMLDNHIYHGNKLEIDPTRIFWPRVMDMSDRALREIKLEYGKSGNPVIRESGFDITASSEVMAVLCLTGDLMDMKERLGKIIVAFTFHGQPISADHLMAQGAMALLLKEAIKPNLVQTVEGVPAFVHGGPFANIAHGCNSLVATRLALKLSDYVVTEAGFGTDLGAEKFFDIKCRMGNLKPDAVVLVVTARALKRQGGVPKEEVLKENVEALKRGLDNLEKHIENVRIFGVPLVVAINKTVDDSRGEIEAMAKGCKGFGEKAVISEVWEKGGEGGLDLAKEVLSIIEKEPSKFKPLYDLNASIRSKIETIASKIYGADGVDYMAEADRDIKIVEEMGFSKLPVCIAKTQFSLTDDPTKLGRPKGFRINVKRIRASAGAGFLVAYTGDIMTMPGLPPHPAAERIDILPDGKIVGLF